MRSNYLRNFVIQSAIALDPLFYSWFEVIVIQLTESVLDQMLKTSCDGAQVTQTALKN